jgi:hypothetical protein
MAQLYAIVDWTQDIIDKISAFGERYLELIVLIFAAALLLVHLRGRVDKLFIVLLTLLALLIVLLFAALAYSQEPTSFLRIASVLVVYGAVMFVLLSELLLRGFARFLTSKRGEKWTKEMDYFYLTFGVIGIIGSLSRVQFLTGSFDKVDIIAPILLMTAVVIRYIKTRAEIGEWNKLR